MLTPRSIDGRQSFGSSEEPVAGKRALVVMNDPARRSVDAKLHEELTNGYARALQLDATCVRLLRRITVLAASGEERSSPELKELTDRLASAQRELAELRSRLAELRAQIDPQGDLL
jgi:hypothetical protein